MPDMTITTVAGLLSALCALGLGALIRQWWGDRQHQKRIATVEQAREHEARLREEAARHRGAAEVERRVAAEERAAGAVEVESASTSGEVAALVNRRRGR